MKQKSAIIIVLAMLMLCSFASTAYAADAAPSVGENELLIARTLTKIVAIVIPAILASIFIAGLGYWKNNEGNFSLEKFIYTIVLSAIIAAITSYAGWTESQAQTWFANTGLTIPLYWLVQGIVARYGKYLPFLNHTSPVTPPPPTPQPEPEYVLLTIKTADTHGGVAPTGVVQWLKNDDVRIMADPSAGYDFDYWEVDNMKTTLPAYFNTTANAAHTFIAHFKPK